MESFHHSRGRVLFEVLCALVISASCAGAWMQTGATALLPATAVAALYGLVHAFDMRRRAPAVAAASGPIDLPRIPEPVVPVVQPTRIPAPPIVEQPLTTDNSTTEAGKGEPEAARPSRPRRAKAAPKGGRRRTAAREDKVTELPPPVESALTEAAQPEEANLAVPAPLDEPKVTDLTPSQDTPPPRPDETSPVPLRPLFEPEPFVRQQRAAFGRKA